MQSEGPTEITLSLNTVTLGLSVEVTNPRFHMVRTGSRVRFPTSPLTMTRQPLGLPAHPVKVAVHNEPQIRAYRLVIDGKELLIPHSFVEAAPAVKDSLEAASTQQP